MPALLESGRGAIYFNIGGAYSTSALPAGGTWYCKTATTQTVGISGHNPIVGCINQPAFYSSGGSPLGAVMVYAIRIYN